MNRIFKTLALAAAITAMAVPAFAAESAPLHQTVKSLQKLEVKSAGNEHFTGEVVTAALYGPQAPSKSYAATVTFSPGARTYWHIHEMGQTLIVTEGTGWTQEWGKKPVMLKPGDIVRCPPMFTPRQAMTRQKNTPLLLLPTPTAALKKRLQGCTPSALPHSATSPSRRTLLIRAQAKANRAIPTNPFTTPKTFTAWPIIL